MINIFKFLLLGPTSSIPDPIFHDKFYDQFYRKFYPVLSSSIRRCQPPLAARRGGGRGAASGRCRPAGARVFNKQRRFRSRLHGIHLPGHVSLPTSSPLLPLRSVLGPSLDTHPHVFEQQRRAYPLGQVYEQWADKKCPHLSRGDDSSWHRVDRICRAPFPPTQSWRGWAAGRGPGTKCGHLNFGFGGEGCEAIASCRCGCYHATVSRRPGCGHFLSGHRPGYMCYVSF